MAAPKAAGAELSKAAKRNRQPRVAARCSSNTHRTHCTLTSTPATRADRAEERGRGALTGEIACRGGRVGIQRGSGSQEQAPLAEEAQGRRDGERAGSISSPPRRVATDQLSSLPYSSILSSVSSYPSILSLFTSQQSHLSLLSTRCSSLLSLSPSWPPSPPPWPLPSRPSL